MGTYAGPEVIPITKQPNPNQSNLYRILNYSIDDIMKIGDKGILYHYLNNKSKEINGMSYFPYWPSGDLFVWNKDDKGTMSLQVVDIATAIRNSKTQNPDLYNYLRESWDLFNGY
jgi:hypothetical protein